MSTEIIAGKMLIAALRKAYKRDRANRYRINQPWSLPRLADPVLDYTGRYVSIRDNIITVQPSEICDGATLSPDRVGRWSLVEAALAHDALYAELDGIAAAWDWPRARVRRWADDVFYGIASHRAPHWLARLYWRGIRATGGIAHAVGKLVAIAFLAACIAGCSGCATPRDPFAPDQPPPAPPDYTKIAALSPVPRPPSPVPR